MKLQALQHCYRAWKVSRCAKPEVTQTCTDVESLTLPCSELSYYSRLVSGPLSSNYCTLMAGPITSRLIVWSLPYVQPAVMLIHFSTHTWAHHAASHTAQLPLSQEQSVLVENREVCQGEFRWEVKSKLQSIKQKNEEMSNTLLIMNEWHLFYILSHSLHLRFVGNCCRWLSTTISSKSIVCRAV